MRCVLVLLKWSAMRESGVAGRGKERNTTGTHLHLLRECVGRVRDGQCVGDVVNVRRRSPYIRHGVSAVGGPGTRSTVMSARCCPVVDLWNIPPICPGGFSLVLWRERRQTLSAWHVCGRGSLHKCR